MIRNKISKLIKASSRKSKVSSFEKRMMIVENATNEQSSKDYNPRKARNRSLRGIAFSSK